MATTKQREVMTVKEAAFRARIHPGTLTRLLRDGKIAGQKIGGQWRVPTEAIECSSGQTHGDRK